MKTTAGSLPGLWRLPPLRSHDYANFRLDPGHSTTDFLDETSASLYSERMEHVDLPAYQLSTLIRQSPDPPIQPPSLLVFPQLPRDTSKTNFSNSSCQNTIWVMMMPSVPW